MTNEPKEFIKDCQHIYTNSDNSLGCSLNKYCHAKCENYKPVEDKSAEYEKAKEVNVEAEVKRENEWTYEVNFATTCNGDRATYGKLTGRSKAEADYIAKKINMPDPDVNWIAKMGRVIIIERERVMEKVDEVLKEQLTELDYHSLMKLINERLECK